MSTLNGDSLPRGWAIAPLSDIAEVNPRGPDRLPNDDDLVSFVPMAAVETMSGRLSSRDLREWKAVKRGFTRFQEGDVLFAKITPCMENGKVALASGLHAGIGAGSTEFHVLRPTRAAEGKFLMYYTLQEQFRKDARAKMTGTAGQLRVPASFLEERVLALPQVSEQRRIVGAIESYLTKLDAAVAALERARANLKRYRSSVLKAAVEGRIVPTEADLARREGRDFEPASVLLERILAERRRRWEESQLARMKAAGKPPKDDRWKSKYKEPAGPDTSTLPRLPDGWCWATVEQLDSGEEYALTIGPFGSNLKVSDYALSGVPLIFVRNIRAEEFGDSMNKFISENKAANLRPHCVLPGDILVTKMGDPPGDVCMYPHDRPVGVITADCIRWAPSALLPDRKLLVQFLRSEIVQRQILSMTKGVAQRKVSLARFRRLAIPVAPIAEQSSLIERIDRLLSIGDESERVTQSSIGRSARLRQAILKWAFEGKLVDQDPNDEPASVLLERIRTERASAAPPRKPKKNETRQTEAAK